MSPKSNPRKPKTDPPNVLALLDSALRSIVGTDAYICVEFELELDTFDELVAIVQEERTRTMDEVLRQAVTWYLEDRKHFPTRQAAAENRPISGGPISAPGRRQGGEG
jgi:hypothetical protein